MSQLGKYPKSQDDRLADFTDQAQAAEVTQVESDADDELLALEETILRLKNAFPPAALDQSTVKQMQVRFNARVRREAQSTKQPFWKKLFEPQAYRQFGMVFATAALLIALAVFSPSMNTVGSSTSATALTPMKSSFVVIALTGAVLIFIWIRSRD